MRNTLLNLTLVLVAAAPAWGAIILDTDPSSGSITVEAGSFGGWGFTFTTTDNNYYVLTGVEFCIGAAPPGTGTCNNTAVGTFADFASGNGIIVGPGYSPSPYSEPFNFPLPAIGLGGFFADSSAAAQILSGALYVYYDLYGGDPGAGGNQLGANLSISHAAQVTIVDATTVPEPSSLLLVSLAAAGFLLKRR